MSTRSEVLMWAQRVIARKRHSRARDPRGPADATAEDAQAAFHKVARTAHPDLHRNGLTPEELEMVTSAYAHVGRRVSDAPRAGDATHADEAAQDGGRQLAAAARHAGPTPATQRRVRPHTAAVPAPPARMHRRSMSSKALVYYRKAELALRRGDLKGAVLQLKLRDRVGPDVGLSPNGTRRGRDSKSRKARSFSRWTAPDPVPNCRDACRGRRPELRSRDTGSGIPKTS